MFNQSNKETKEHKLLEDCKEEEQPTGKDLREELQNSRNMTGSEEKG